MVVYTEEFLRNEWKKYVGSIAWYRLKDQALKIAGYKCHGSGDYKNPCQHTDLEMHHRVYPEYPFAENDRVEYVEILCRDCHQSLHDAENYVAMSGD